MKRARPVTVDLEVHEQETKEFHSALGLCITRWANVEFELLRIFQLCLKGANHILTAAAFYSIENFRSKVAAVDSVLSVALKDHPALSEWSGKGGILQQMNAKAKSRNTIAHAMAIHLSTGTPGNSVYLRRTLFDPTMPPFIPTRPTHGYFTRDLYALGASFYELSLAIQRFGVRADEPVKQFLKSSEQEQRRLMTHALKSLSRAKREVQRRSSRKSP